MSPTATTNGNNGVIPPSNPTSRIQPDPELVQYPDYSNSQPVTREDFFKRAEEVAELLHLDEAERDRGNVVPYRQVQLLKDSGLATLLGPKSSGGGGLKWSEAYQVVRRVARGDGSLAMILGYSYLWYWAAALVGTEEQRSRIEAWLTEKKAIIGGAVNPRDDDLKVINHPNDKDKLIFDGKKSFSTGSKVSDVTILEGTNDKGEHIFAAVESKQPGIKYGDQWVDVLGMRATQSGGITISNVEVPWKDALGYDPKTHEFQPLGPYNTLNLPTIQLVFTSFYLGISEGSLKRGLEYTKKNTRGWPYQPNPVSNGVDEFYIQDIYGTLQARVWANAAQIDSVIELASEILHTEDRTKVTEEQRAEFAVKVAAAKVNAVDFGLEVTSKIYELQGARSVGGKYGYDVAWRDLRTHSLHDPIAHKRAEVGRYSLNPGKDGWPVPTWYT